MIGIELEVRIVLFDSLLQSGNGIIEIVRAIVDGLIGERDVTLLLHGNLSVQKQSQRDKYDNCNRKVFHMRAL